MRGSQGKPVSDVGIHVFQVGFLGRRLHDHIDCRLRRDIHSGRETHVLNAVRALAVRYAQRLWWGRTYRRHGAEKCFLSTYPVVFSAVYPLAITLAPRDPAASIMVLTALAQQRRPLSCRITTAVRRHGPRWGPHVTIMRERRVASRLVRCLATSLGSDGTITRTERELEREVENHLENHLENHDGNSGSGNGRARVGFGIIRSEHNG